MDKCVCDGVTNDPFEKARRFWPLRNNNIIITRLMWCSSTVECTGIIGRNIIKIVINVEKKKKKK